MLAVVTLALLGPGTMVASAAVAPGDRAPASVERVHRYYPAGPSADYSGDSGSLASGPPLTFRVPDVSDLMAVVEVSFEYRTKGTGPFRIGNSVGDPEADPGDDGTGGDVTVRPQEFELAPAPRPTTTTVRFVVPVLSAGQRYATEVGVNSVFARDNHDNIIRTRKMLVTVELTAR